MGEYWLQAATGLTTALTYGSDITTHTFLCDRYKFTSDLTYRQVPETINGGLFAEYGNFEGNYTVFSGLTNDSFIVRTSEFNSRSPIQAIQIIPRTNAPAPYIDPLLTAVAYSGSKVVFRVAAAGVAHDHDLSMEEKWRQS